VNERPIWEGVTPLAEDMVHWTEGKTPVGRNRLREAAQQHLGDLYAQRYSPAARQQVIADTIEDDDWVRGLDGISVSAVLHYVADVLSARPQNRSGKWRNR
jgi:hypothetical protein